MKYLILALFAIILGMFTNVTATEVTAIEKGVYFDVRVNHGVTQHIDVFIPVALVYDDDVGVYDGAPTLSYRFYANEKRILTKSLLVFRRARDGLMCSEGEFSLNNC